MSKINRIRIMNLNYNGNTIRIDDETFDLGGDTTLLSLRNGGGKTVLVQMIISLFVNKKYRDSGERAFKSYFTTNRPTFIMTEWKLDKEQGYFLVGMMVRKAQNIENNNEEELEMITFTGFYKDACEYDMDNIAVINCENGTKILKGFGTCKQEFERLRKENNTKFSYYDMSQAHQRRSYFSKLREYQINNKEWETIIKQVNLKESGLSELFADAKDEKGLVEKWFLRAIENKLDQENNRIKRFQNLAYKFVCQYRENQSKIERKDTIEKFFTDANVMQEQIHSYCDATQEVLKQKSVIAVFINKVNEMVKKLEEDIEETDDEIKLLEERINRIEYEQISYDIHLYEEERKELVTQQTDCEIQINHAVYQKKQVDKELCKYECAKKYRDKERSKKEINELREKIRIKREEDIGSEEERNKLGGNLFFYYDNEIQNMNVKIKEKDCLVEQIKKDKLENEQLRAEEYANRIKLSKVIGKLEAEIGNFDREEKSFNHKQKESLSRNILGEYEEGLLAVYQKQYNDRYTDINAHITKLAEEKFTLEKKEADFNRKNNTLAIENDRAEQEVWKLKERIQELTNEKMRRSIILKYLELSEDEINNKQLISEKLKMKQKELEDVLDTFKRVMDTLKNEYNQLKESKVMELPKNLITYFETLGIDFFYGMEWIKKNGRTEEENVRLVKNNPFIPYSIIISKKDLELLKNTKERIYTKFPVPIIVKELLQSEMEASEEHIRSFETISFLCYFNTQLLNPEALEHLILEIKKQIEMQNEKIENKRKEIEEYRGYYDEIKNQEYSEELLGEILQHMEDIIDRQQKIKEEMEQNKAEIKILIDKKKDNEKYMDAEKRQRMNLEICICEFEALCKLYQEYLNQREEKARKEKLYKEAEKNIEAFNKKIHAIQEEIDAIQREKMIYEKKRAVLQKDGSEFSVYKNATTILEADFDFDKALVRYHALTDGISATMKELEKQLEKEDKVYIEKCEELEEINRYNFSKQDYAEVIISKESRIMLEQRQEQAVREENAAKELKSDITGRLGKVDTKLEMWRKNLWKQCGTDIPVAKNEISDIQFSQRCELAKYEKKSKLQKREELDTRLKSFQSNQSAMAEYVDFEVICEVEEILLDEYSKKQLDEYQGNLRRTLRQKMDYCQKMKETTMNLINSIGQKEEYQDDFFKKGLDNCLSVVDNADSVKMQLITVCRVYEEILKKLQVDLENIDKERANVHETFMEYIREIDEQLRQIDKNSNISIRGRNVKMLKISVPNWDENKEFYHVRLRDFIDSFINRGLDAIEKNENVEEVLGKRITSKRLYDEIAGIGNVGIRLYKIEVEREVPISWQEVASNSGGEGFLSAFVVLSCLLSYMRRDENDLFATGEEGKVLIMDNPFAQTNATHLLKPLMEMAKKTNTQLICLSALGGDSIYNRFDNIYVLNIEKSVLKKGMSYMESKHIKGESIGKMVLSQIKVEQGSN